MLRRAGGDVVELGSGGLPLGMRPSVDVEAETVTIEDGDLLVLFSDGLPEAVDGNREAFGFDRVRSLLSTAGSAQVVHDRIVMAVDQHRAGDTVDDDLTLVVMARQTTVTPPPPPRVGSGPADRMAIPDGPS
jgi:sigma-B regulation protein RsbU (phosphoserine phosphatase)